MGMNEDETIENYVRIGGTCYAHSGSNIPLNEWVHLVMTAKTGDKLLTYRNGVQVLTTSLPSGTFEVTANSLQIAGYSGNVTPPKFQGLIDEVRIYAEALPSAEIQKHYVQGLNKLLANNAITEEEYNQRITAFNQSLVQK